MIIGGRRSARRLDSGVEECLLVWRDRTRSPSRVSLLDFIANKAHQICSYTMMGRACFGLYGAYLGIFLSTIQCLIVGLIPNRAYLFQKYS